VRGVQLALENPLRQLLLVEARVLDADGRLRGHRRQQTLVARGERAAVLVQKLHDADDLLLRVEHRRGEDRARAEAGDAVEFAVEARVGVGIRDVERFACLRDVPGDPLPHLDADLGQRANRVEQHARP
jgi:hypothetical protein